MENEFYINLEKLILESTDNANLKSPASILAEVGSPTTSIAILEDGQISQHCISTINDNTSTLFQACSISKPAAGLVIMRLIEMGYFTLDSHALDLLPPTLASTLTPTPTLAALWQKISIKHLMSHTSGLSVGGFSGYADHTTVPSASEVLTSTNNTNTQPVHPISPPGLEYNYSGGGITVLQCIIEHTTSLPFATIMQTYVFQPLSMTHSFYNPLPTTEKNLTRCYHHGYTPTPTPWHILPEQAAAGLWTTPTDLLKMLRAVQDSLAGRPGALLKRETAQMMLTAVKPDQSDMGLTWFTTRDWFGHSGSNEPGWRCYLFGSKVGGKGVAVMTNSACGNGVIWKVVNAVSWLKGWGQVPLFRGSLAWGCPFGLRVEGEVYDGVWRGWVGRWGVAAGERWVWSIEEYEGRPVARTEEAVKLNLRPAAMPAVEYEGRKRSWDLVVDGVAVVLRLGWDGEERVVEMWSDGSGRWRTLRKRESESDS